MRHRILLAILCLLPMAACTRSGPGTQKPRLAYVSNGVASFWTIAEAGALKAGRDLDVDVDVRMPVEGVLDQKRIVEDLLARGIDGIAISPIDPDNQEDLINEACDHTTVITQDSDAPRTRRLCYVGMDNYKAGRLVGKLVREAMPEGGSVMLFVGRLEQLNASQRRQGVIDELLDRPGETMGAVDPPNAVLKGERYTILDTRTDQFDQAKAKANCEDAIARYPDLGCMVGLFAYNPPACLVALEQAGVDGIHLVGFDEADATLQGIVDGRIHGTVVQQPYQYGYESVRILAGLAKGDRSVLPENGFLDIPAQTIRADNVREFWDDLKRKMAEAKGPTP